LNGTKKVVLEATRILFLIGSDLAGCWVLPFSAPFAGGTWKVQTLWQTKLIQEAAGMALLPVGAYLL